jgi:hypothetical protein
MARPALPLADTSDMIGLHRVFRTALDAAPSFVGGVAPGDSTRAETVAMYYEDVLQLLHAHHEGEDMEKHMPPPLHEFWTGPGRGLFADYIGQLRG